MMKKSHELHTAAVPYEDQGVLLEGFAAYPAEKKQPTVILCHSWSGCDAYICEKAKWIASLGYTGFALDVYGKGVIGKSSEENAALKKPFVADRLLLQRRLLKALEAALSLPCVDAKRIAAVGFGFGGMCALDLARSGADLRGVASVYGHLDPPAFPCKKTIQAKILVLHGYGDPIAPQSGLLSFQREMEDAHVDWQTHVYGHTLHAFTNPRAADARLGTLYNPVAERRALLAIQNFLEEVLI